MCKRFTIGGRAAAAALAIAMTAGAQQLFNGKNLDGWEFLGREPGQQGFAVEDGVMHTSDGKGMLWYTREKIGNATIHVVYKMSSDKGNSGVFIRIPAPPKAESDAINKGIEVQIDNRDNDWHCTGVLYSMTKAMARPYKPAGEWNTMDITLDGLRTIVKVNGVLVTDYDGVSPVPAKEKSYEPDRGPRPESGYIGLQKHDGEAVISFKEISVRPLRK
jgi:Domain of Unknown Function (DUF1080)